jgi:type II secretory pathway component PulF
MFTMLSIGIPMVRALDITGSVVGNAVYEDLLKESAEGVRAGAALSTTFQGHEEIPSIIVQIVKVGEESGDLGEILKTMADFYKRDVETAVDTLIGLIEPILIVGLGIGIGVLLASVLMPIYGLATAF